ncbi:ExbD/TolR family protein, partial [Verrucomicrobiota bacterium]
MNQRPTYERLIDFHRRFKAKHHFARGYSFAAVMLNAALLLLGFYILNSHFVLQPGIQLELPTAPFADGVPFLQSTIVTLSRDGSIFCDDERTTVDGLSDAFARAVHANPNRTLLIEADKRVQYGRLVEVYNKAQAAGIQKIMMATRASSLTGKS